MLRFTLQGSYHRNTIDVGGCLDTGQLAKRWQHIPVSRNVIAGAARFDRAGPASQQRSPNAAFVEITFVTFQRSVAVEEVGIVAAFR